MSVRTPSQPPRPAKGLPRTFIALCIVVAAPIGAYCVLILVSLATASTEHRTRTYALAARQLRIESGSADVRVVGERRRGVRVDAEIQRGMFRNGFQPRVAMRQQGLELQVESHCSLMAHVGVGNCGASFTVYVPRGTSLTVNTASGDVHVEDVAGALRVTASSEDIHVSGYRGTELVAKTTGGDVEVSTQRAPRRLRVEAGSDDVDVAVPDAVYRVLVDAGSGDRNVTVRQSATAPRTIQVSTASGDVSVTSLADAD